LNKEEEERNETPVMPAALLELLQDPKIIKTGVAINQDIGLLWRDYGIKVCGVVDLQPLAHKYRYTGIEVCVDLF
jgi:hypothetical protein